MKIRLFPALGLAASLLLLTSCTVLSVNPLSSPETAHIDPQLVGDWRGDDVDDNETFRFSVTNEHWMHVDIIRDHVKSGDSGKKQEKPESYDFFPTTIGNYTFLNVKMVGKDDAGHPTKAYLFVRYTISSGRKLHMWQMTEDEAADAVRAGKVKGSVEENKDTFFGQSHEDVNVTLNGKSEELVKFLENTNVKELFGEKMDTLYRVKKPETK